MDNVKADRKADRLRSPFIVNDPFSKKADKVGLNDGELICNYADDAVALIDIRKDLQKEVDALIGEESAPKIGITRFKNWGKTNEALLLLVKPTTKEQVVAVVKGVRNLNEKKEVKVNYMPQYNKICSMCVLSGKQGYDSIYMCIYIYIYHLLHFTCTCFYTPVRWRLAWEAPTTRGLPLILIVGDC